MARIINLTNFPFNELTNFIFPPFQLNRILFVNSVKSGKIFLVQNFGIKRLLTSKYIINKNKLDAYLIQQFRYFFLNDHVSRTDEHTLFL